jgi:hypothetical protein
MRPGGQKQQTGMLDAVDSYLAAMDTRMLQP